MEPTNRAAVLGARVLRAPSVAGLLFAAFLIGPSVSPSLLARGWLFQGVVTGVALAVGYGLGALLTRLAKAARRRWGWGWSPLAPAADLRLHAGVVLLVLALLVWTGVRAVDQHRWTWDRLGYERSSLWLVYGGTVLVAGCVAAVLFGVAWVFGRVQAWLTRIGRRWVPAWIAGGVAFVVLAWAVLAALNTQVLHRTLDGVNATFEAADTDVDGQAPPVSRVRSAGPASAVDWTEVGREGRRFLTRGPRAATIARLAPDDGSPTSEPVRVYVGRASAETTDERVALAVDELERLGAFERRAILVVVPTGTGWINEQIVQPLEYFFDGDVATVALQYSHLPSPLAFLAEGHAAGESGAALVAAVRARHPTRAAGGRRESGIRRRRARLRLARRHARDDDRDVVDRTTRDDASTPGGRATARAGIAPGQAADRRR